MKAFRPDREQSVQQQMTRMLFTFFAPTLLILLLIFLLLLLQNTQYADILHNVTTASEFNQDFKSSIGQKMYYYVIESRYSEGLPLDEVDAAKRIAGELLLTTTDRESRRSISSVLNLCENLDEKIRLIASTENYDDRQTQLENNIYVLTSLIQQYMYDYLYSEAALLHTMQLEMNRRAAVEAVLVVLVMAMLLAALMRRAFRFGRTITAPITELCRRVSEISGGDLSPHVPVQSGQPEIRALSDGFEQMVVRLNAQIEQTQKEQEQLYRTELALLQAQINPHFLYNTLDNTIWLIEAGRNGDAIEMISELSSFFRSFLSRGNDIITLREEERHIRSYLEIQKFRYQDILDYDIEIDPLLSDCAVPKLTLQPLIENALYHGIKMKRGKGHIHVSGTRSDGEVLLQVCDNGAGISEEHLLKLKNSMGPGAIERVGFGLAAVQERLQLLYGRGYGISIESTPGKGTTVSVRLPFRQQSPQTI